MERKTKLNYLAPRMDVFRIELEQGIASSSSTVSGGKGSTPYAPEIEDWKVGSTGDGYSKGDL